MQSFFLSFFLNIIFKYFDYWVEKFDSFPTLMFSSFNFLCSLSRISKKKKKLINSRWLSQKTSIIPLKGKIRGVKSSNQPPLFFDIHITFQPGNARNIWPKFKRIHVFKRNSFSGLISSPLGNRERERGFVSRL